MAERCNAEGCRRDGVVMVNDTAWCIEHIDQAFAVIRRVRDAIERLGRRP